MTKKKKWLALIFSFVTTRMTLERESIGTGLPTLNWPVVIVLRSLMWEGPL